MDSCQYISASVFEQLCYNNGLTGGVIESPVGLVSYRMLDGRICGIGFDNVTPIHNYLDDIFKRDYIVDETNGEQILDCLINNRFLPLMMRGTPFQHKVWQELLKVPSGSCISYQGLANNLGDMKKVRAVASAVGHNPLSWAVPCHRVIHKNGKTGQYLWGPNIKTKLLELEKFHLNAA